MEYNGCEIRPLANLSGAILSRADLSGANLSKANLYRADLSGANLSGAILSRANLSGADLSGTILYGAILCGANLSGANLSRANLYRADLSGANLPSGETWEDYLGQVVPALLTAGGRTLAEVLATGCWKCHSWDNSPMHVALGISSTSESPLLLRPRVNEFVSFFDAGLIPCPEILPERS